MSIPSGHSTPSTTRGELCRRGGGAVAAGGERVEGGKRLRQAGAYGWQADKEANLTAGV